MPKKIIKAKKKVEAKCEECVCERPKISPLTETFTNGEINVLRDKINEIIARG